MNARTRGWFHLGACVILVGLSACQTPPKESVVVTEHSAVVTIESIDVPHRLVAVRTESGDRLTFYVDESIKDFPISKVGDKVRIRYQESFALELKKSGSSSPELQVKEEIVRPAKGGTRGSSRTETIATVKIERVDANMNTVTFTGPRGRRTVLVTNPKLQEFVKQLKPGDVVEATFVEALALSLEPVR